MATRVQVDTFMDDSDDACPLCVEEFDLSDKNFRPCPCGYQVCQFCYNNIKNNMNGLCPACRRPYDDQSIEWKVVSPEEQKADYALQARKKALVRQKETERRQVENLNRKHLAGLRVVQKNLVYVVGLSPKSREEDLLQTLRGDQYFGQYGKIIKIVVSKAKEGTNGNNSIGVYVTFARKEDAASCIAAVDGSQNGDRVLRAQYGTTKYCSAYLRNEPCNNRGCMFLHETGEDLDSFSRQDLSSINAVSTQRPAPSSSSPSTSSRSIKQPPQPQPPPQQAPQNVTAAVQSTIRQADRDEPMSRSDSGDGSALPSSASWAAKNAQTDSRRSSKPASVSAPSPVLTDTHLPMRVAENETASLQAQKQEQQPSTDSQPQRTLMDRLFSKAHPLDRAMKTVLESSFKFTFDRAMYTDDVLREIDAYPPLFDANGGLVRYRLEQEREQERLKQEEEERNVLGAVAAAEEDDNPASGSLQLGGEPETQDDPSESSVQINTGHRNAIRPPYPTVSSTNPGLGGSTFLGNSSSALSFNGRSLTTQQQQQLSFLRSNSNHQSPVNGQYQSNYSGNNSLHHHQQSNPFQSQNLNLAQIPGLHGHARQASRYNFANDSASASTVAKPAANAQLMAQQAAMMPANQGKHFQNQPMPQSSLQSSHFYSGVHGPPPGLKSSGTPPISGGGMFGQGHGFASAMGGSHGSSGATSGSRNSNDELMRELIRNRGGNINNQGHDVGKREFRFPSSVHLPTTSTAAPASGLLSSLYGAQLDTFHGYQDHSAQKQKKKGKKHRHANTSSSGGGGIVDLADPSILQARMHHGGAGQGQYGVQGQVSQNALRSGESTTAISELNKNTTVDIPEVPLSGTSLSKEITPTTSSVPPGLSLPHDFPPLAAPTKPATPGNIQRRTNITTPAATSIKPVVPVLPTTAPRAAGPGKGSQPGHPFEADSVVNSNTTKSAALEPISKPQLATDTPTPPVPVALPAKATSKNDASVDLPAPQLSQGSYKSDKEGKAGKFSKSMNKRQHPGKLDIAAAKDASQKDLESVAASPGLGKSAESNERGRPVLSGTFQPSTPATAASQSSLPSATRSKQPRPLRALPTPKPVTPPRAAGASPSVLAAAAGSAASKQVSRRGSFSSIHPPGTPLSEKISDNASVASTSMSRPSSPPLNRVGSAPVRQVTKSQQKKERQSRAKQAEESSRLEEAPAKAVVEEPVQAPIIGRKKKAKKTATRGTADSSPSVSRPASPPPNDESIQESMPVTPVKEKKKDTAKVEAEKKEAGSPMSPSFTSTDPQQKPLLTAASIFSNLEKAGAISSAIQEYFKGVSGLNHRFDTAHTDIETINRIPSLTEAQHRELQKGEAICVELANNKRIVILPDHRTLHGLSHDQAQRYLALRRQAINTGDLAMFNSSRRDIDHYLPVAPIPVQATLATTNPRSSSEDEDEDNLNLELVNRFVAPPLSAQPSARSMPSFWNSAAEEQQRGVPVISLAEAEQALLQSRKETEGLEKKLNGLLKKNRRLVFGNGH